MSTLRNKIIRLASFYPSGSFERKALINVLTSSQGQEPLGKALVNLAIRYLGTQGSDWFLANRNDKTLAFVIRTEVNRSWPQRGDGNFTNIPHLLHMKGVPPPIPTFFKALDKILLEYLSENIRLNDGLDIPYDNISVIWVNSETQESEEWSISLYSEYQKPLEKQILGR